LIQEEFLSLFVPAFVRSLAKGANPNEDYPDTAKRPLKEFLGLNTEVRFMGTIRVHDEVENALVAVYAAHADAVPHLNREHSEKGEFLGRESG
jgi:hypothetical protein